MIITESVKLTNFLEPSRPKLGKLLTQIYCLCACFSENINITIAMADEQELKNCARILLVEIGLEQK